MGSHTHVEVVLGLNAAILALLGETPQVLVVRQPTTQAAQETVHPADALPYGPFEPATHRTLEVGLRAWVHEQTGLGLGYVEQLYTFGDRGRLAGPVGTEAQVVSIGYLALTQNVPPPAGSETRWVDWYTYLPWEDHRAGQSSLVDDVIVPQLNRWANSGQDRTSHATRLDRLRLAFGLDGLPWEDERALERYELLYESGLVEEARGVRPGQPLVETRRRSPGLGRAMLHDHRRILATAMARLRAKIRYRPIVFELMADTFTLLELQRAVEAISGARLHKQNFRRWVESGGLVEGTGLRSAGDAGRPAELYRFREDVLRERPSPGLRSRGNRPNR